jgi:hypothetical protein
LVTVVAAVAVIEADMNVVAINVLLELVDEGDEEVPVAVVTAEKTLTFLVEVKVDGGTEEEATTVGAHDNSGKSEDLEVVVEREFGRIFQ